MIIKIPSQGNTTSLLLSLIILLFVILGCSIPKENQNVNKTLNENQNIESQKKDPRSEFLIKNPPENQVVFNLPMMLQLSQSEIEKKLGKPTETERDGDKEGRTYSGKNNSNQVKVAFGYFRGKPYYGRLHLPVAQADSFEAMKQAGIDIGNIQPKGTSTVIDNWYRGEFEGQLYDISVVRGQTNKVDRVVVNIYIPDEIIKDAERIIAEGEKGYLGKLDVGRAKEKLKTIKNDDENYNRAQQLIKKIDEILPRLT
jgi:hypothetical protein